MSIRKKGAEAINELVASILQAFFDELEEVTPEQVTEIEILPGWFSGEWALHVQPAQDWWAVVGYSNGEWWRVLYDYIDVEECVSVAKEGKERDDAIV